MKKTCKPRTFFITNIILVLNLLMYFAIRSMWSGIIAVAGEPVPYILFLLLGVTTTGCTILNMQNKHPKGFMIFSNVLNVIFSALHIYILSQTMDSYYYFIREFGYGLLYIGIIATLMIGCTLLPKLPVFQKAWAPSVLLTLLVIGGLFIALDITPFNHINRTPVVYAVEDTYQIVFTTAAKGEGWVEIDGAEYNDTYAGYRNSENRVHKITVPMDVLDAAGEYTVYTRAMYLRGPYETLRGTTISQTYTWKGVDTTDGIQYYVLSDTHTSDKAPAAASSYWGEDLDFLVSLGDNVNWIDREDDLTEMLYMASDITQGEIPVIYARGNHETKGVKANELYNYVGANEENFYYTFRLKNIWGIVLDFGEDSTDEYVEYYGMAKFNEYREAQTVFLDEVLANAESEFAADGVEYRIAFCHIPLVIAKADDKTATYKTEWMKRLNQMNLTVLFSGHQHELWYIDSTCKKGDVLTFTSEYSGQENNNKQYQITSDVTFPTILVSRRADSQLLSAKEEYFDTAFIGLAVSSDGNETILKYTNEKGNVLKTISPWFSDIKYGKEIQIPNIK